MSVKRRAPSSPASPALLVIEAAKFERRSLCRMLRATGAEHVTEAADIAAAQRILAVRRWPQWMLVADPDRLADAGVQALRDLAASHRVLTTLLLTERKPAEAEELRAHAAACGLPVLAVVRKPMSAEQAGTLLRSLGEAEPAKAWPVLSRDELHECLRTGRVRARFEPKIDLRSGRPVSCETISYVAHAHYGEIPASGLNDAVAQLGAHRMVTASALREAAALVRSLRAKGLAATVSVNLGFEVLSEPGDAGALDAYVRTLGIAPSDLVLELDAGRHAHADTFGENLARLKLRGYTLSLEHAAATPALDLPAHVHFSEIKLNWADKGTPSTMPEQLALSVAVADAHKQGLSTCAVGVRTVSDLERARQAGVRAGQGELFAGSMPAAEALLWIEREERNRTFADRALRQNQAV